MDGSGLPMVMGLCGGVMRWGDGTRFGAGAAASGGAGMIAEEAGDMGVWRAATGLGAILTSSNILARGGGGYPRHSFLDRTHCVHAGRFSSHFILRCLDCTVQHVRSSTYDGVYSATQDEHEKWVYTLAVVAAGLDLGLASPRPLLPLRSLASVAGLSCSQAIWAVSSHCEGKGEE
jgi:hypothetical protein